MPDGVARAGSGAADGEIPDKVPDILWGTFAPAIQARVGAIHRELREQKADGTFPQDKDLLWMKALVRFMEVIDGRAAALAKAPEKKPDSWWATNVTGLMVISAFLALAFGVLGVFGLASSGTAKEATAGFLDIAKLFAGALVGAAGAVVAAKR